MEKWVLQMHRVEEKAWEQMSPQKRSMLIQTTCKFRDLIQKELQSLKLE